jgi:protein required for attachment to host cells
MRVGLDARQPTATPNAHNDMHSPQGDVMKPEWILIANATRARLLQREHGSPLVVVQSFEHPQGRAKTSELADDRAGQGKTDHSFGGASYPPRIAAKYKEHLRFARELAEYLEHQAQQGNFHSLALFASSPFLGEVKALLGKATTRLLTATHDLDLTSVGLVELDQRIAHESAH